MSEENNEGQEKTINLGVGGALAVNDLNQLSELIRRVDPFLYDGIADQEMEVGAKAIAAYYGTSFDRQESVPRFCKRVRDIIIVRHNLHSRVVSNGGLMMD